MAKPWTPSSWRVHAIRQIPAYPDAAALARVERELGKRPGLVAAADIDRLREKLAEVAAGRAFLLQGGDCAESLADFDPAHLTATFGLILRMALVLAWSARRPVVKIGRFAGQFAKPRSQATETQGAHPLPAYRGDSINGSAFTEAARTPDPARMLRAYDQSAQTLALLEAWLASGAADPRRLVEAGGELPEPLSAIAPAIAEATDFTEAWGADPAATRLYASHEALLLPFEQALARRGPDGRSHAASGHFLWIGDRTRFAGSAHVEFARGLANPIGIKCGPELDADTLLALLETLDPERVPGRITLITRFGAERAGRCLPPLVRAVQRAGHPVIWSCDPMHGNTIRSASGYKTRPFDRILAETRIVAAIHRAEGSRLGGIHVEMTGRDVTECTGGPMDLAERDLGDRYHSHCDPRLNAAQALELA
ncbi:MAG: 3-deoxy-7-phosphoheptulonate synthase, partial [Sphingomonadales bacterium]|nr:3-deoxy-7-phosphoheptulonate synthase [Sphingomonadales bacterium]